VIVPVRNGGIFNDHRSAPQENTSLPPLSRAPGGGSHGWRCLGEGLSFEPVRAGIGAAEGGTDVTVREGADSTRAGTGGQS
jgi:hypothetical protein